MVDIDRCAFLPQNFSEILDSLDTIATEIEDAAAAQEPEPEPELQPEQELEPEPKSQPEQEPGSEPEPTEEGIPPDTADTGGGGGE